MNSTQAHNQWRDRPIDERYWTVADMLAALTQRMHESVTPHIGRLTASADYGVLSIGEIGSDRYQLGHYAFGQLAQLAGAPAGYLRQLPTDLAAECLNTGLEEREPDTLRALIHAPTCGDHVIRAITTTKYSRVWDAAVVESVVMPLLDAGWIVPPAYATSDCILARKVRTAAESDLSPVSLIALGDTIGPAGLYAGDRDMFAFLVHPGRHVFDGTSQLFRAMIIRNSEVGAACFEAAAFLLRYVCGNHILWGCQELGRVKWVHRGEAVRTRATYDMLQAAATWADRSPDADQAKIMRAKSLPIIPGVLDMIAGKRREETVSALNKRGIGTRSQLAGAWDTADSNGENPETVWGFVQGLTQQSQASSAYADDRVAQDGAAAKLLANV